MEEIFNEEEEVKGSIHIKQRESIAWVNPSVKGPLAFMDCKHCIAFEKECGAKSREKKPRFIHVYTEREEHAF